MSCSATEAAGWFWVVAPDTHLYTLDHRHFGPRLQSPRGGALVTIADVLHVVDGAPAGPRRWRC